MREHSGDLSKEILSPASHRRTPRRAESPQSPTRVEQLANRASELSKRQELPVRTALIRVVRGQVGPYDQRRIITEVAEELGRRGGIVVAQRRAKSNPNPAVTPPALLRAVKKDFTDLADSAGKHWHAEAQRAGLKTGQELEEQLSQD